MDGELEIVAEQLILLRWWECGNEIGERHLNRGGVFLHVELELAALGRTQPGDVRRERGTLDRSDSDSLVDVLNHLLLLRPDVGNRSRRRVEERQCRGRVHVTGALIESGCCWNAGWIGRA